ncbi:hypothetical protein TRVL_07399 [Trypanosoma vivax]|uniref:Uncharacterized protein n=1 Tax=Trypanosoma vivax (strain Y486) TaxID=1055687 RepID=G0TU10_TRYVY|nr:hypothetical protein TRVL_07399 [Trypanosoma vivax]CCC47443.1 conserved hypothetical protein [Trypanosoma vivax Y486]
MEELAPRSGGMHLKGVARGPKNGAPRGHMFTGIVAAAPINMGEACGILAVATLSASAPHEGEVTLLSVEIGRGQSTPMVVARLPLRFETEPRDGIAKVVWANRTVIAVMSSSGEVLCLRSGLLMPSEEGDSSIEESESSDEGKGIWQNCSSCIPNAVDMCALSVNHCPVVITASSLHTSSYAFPNVCCNIDMRHEHRKLCIGPFHLVAGVSSSPEGHALLIGCTLGSVSVFEWACRMQSPVAVRTFLIGSPKRYVALSIGSFNSSEPCSCTDGTGQCDSVRRTVTVYALGNGEIEDKVGPVATLMKVDGTPMETLLGNSVDTTQTSPDASVLPSWNTVLVDSTRRVQATSSLLHVTQSRLQKSPSNLPHVLAIKIVQYGQFLSAGGLSEAAATTARTDTEASQQKRFSLQEPLQSSFNVKMLLMSSNECERAFSIMGSGMTMLPAIRHSERRKDRDLGEFCLCGANGAVIWGVDSHHKIEPQAVVRLNRCSERLVGLTWIPGQEPFVHVLSGCTMGDSEPVDGLEEANEGKGGTSCAVGELVLQCVAPQLWSRREGGPLTEERVKEIVEEAVRREGERVLGQLDERLRMLEYSISKLLQISQKDT